MSLRINHNIASINGHRNMLRNDAAISKSLEKLSSGLRINRAADDAAGLVISEQMRAQITGLNQAIDNSETARSMVQTAEGALDEMNSLLSKARELVLHAANDGANDQNQLNADQAELNEIISSVTRISQTTQFGNKKILDGSIGNTMTVAAGTDGTGVSTTAVDSVATFYQNEAIELNTSYNVKVIDAASSTEAPTVGLFKGSTKVADLNLVTVSANDESVAEQHHDYIFANTDWGIAAVTFSTDTATANTVVVDNISYAFSVSDAAAAFQIGANDYKDLVDEGQRDEVSIRSMASDQVGLVHDDGNDYNLKSIADDLMLADADIDTTNSALKVIDQAINDVTNLRGQLGAFQANTLETNLNSLRVSMENLTAAESTIRDVDFAAESAQFTRNNIMIQASTAMLAQANQLPQNVLQLLG